MIMECDHDCTHAVPGLAKIVVWYLQHIKLDT